jgi:hypothetical protein
MERLHHERRCRAQYPATLLSALGIGAATSGRTRVELIGDWMHYTEPHEYGSPGILEQFTFRPDGTGERRIWVIAPSQPLRDPVVHEIEWTSSRFGHLLARAHGSTEAYVETPILSLTERRLVVDDPGDPTGFVWLRATRESIEEFARTAHGSSRAKTAPAIHCARLRLRVEAEAHAIFADRGIGKDCSRLTQEGPANDRAAQRGIDPREDQTPDSHCARETRNVGWASKAPNHLGREAREPLVTQLAHDPNATTDHLGVRGFVHQQV